MVQDSERWRKTSAGAAPRGPCTGGSSRASPRSRRRASPRAPTPRVQLVRREGRDVSSQYRKGGGGTFAARTDASASTTCRRGQGGSRARLGGWLLARARLGRGGCWNVTGPASRGTPRGSTRSRPPETRPRPRPRVGSRAPARSTWPQRTRRGRAGPRRRESRRVRLVRGEGRGVST